MFFVYVIRCSDNSLYTGYTTDYKRRFEEHKSKSIKSAKYTKARGVTSLEAVWSTDSKSSALKLEAFIKKLKKADKERIIKNPELISAELADGMEINKYEPVKIED